MSVTRETSKPKIRIGLSGGCLDTLAEVGAISVSELSFGTGRLYNPRRSFPVVKGTLPLFEVVEGGTSGTGSTGTSGTGSTGRIVMLAVVPAGATTRVLQRVRGTVLEYCTSLPRYRVQTR